ncbi:MAG: hypothetical protein A3G33_04640 [Omnitrophica bacterium RIFCSPLOWO2_12_FULL_44_17]|uniref:Glycosyl transferase family 1 domain-containing protein n=1 Tax=Candidatus Danuiimicrobium aquiferis TaxID=1801832 RepID=A0A1G1KQM8_9BACT|nr:MAG: hypothetical protein A3B72_10850 [Omnitrophica bacterium RIFCSPHIGHO2_02_FULL_45_28]OGW88087.1 MAG: hypothetical protein A3E74_04370 [Omnitrophica bacterium RIFCSPHIGHO2_12_FULL_44_12]OGW95221.1 MAG: hypothetical protein A3G33_04640 [Omnitrophica bacterium RIFCSPLOWO2_12_FULL_44_17]
MTMKILALVTDAFGGEFGIAEYNRCLLEAMAEVSEDAEVIVLPRLKQRFASEIPGRISQKDVISNKFLYVINVIKVLCLDGPFDLVFCGHIHLSSTSMFISKIFRIPFWIQLHGVEGWEKHGFFQKLAANCADLILSVSQYTKERFLQSVPISSEKVRVLPNMVRKCFIPGVKPVQLLEKYGLKDKKIILTVARLDRKDRDKGIALMIEILPELIKHFQDLVYVVVGDGDDRSYLESLSRKHNVSACVVFAGKITERSLPDFYRMADLFVMPSTKEGFGIVYLESMACGIPAIGSGVDGSRDLLKHGLIAGSADQGALCRLILQKLSEGHLPDFLMSERIHQEFGREQFLSRVKKIFHEQRLI